MLGLSSGPEWFLFPHIMDIVRWFIGRGPVDVYAKGHRGVLESRGIDCWDAVQALVGFEGKAFGTFETSRWRQRDRGVIPVVTNRDLRRTWKTLAGQAGVPKEIRDRIQNHALQDVSSKSYDRWNYIM